MALRAGSRVGPYRVVETLGQGGMASVYKAYDPDLDRHVALKVLATEFLREPDFAKRFRREAKVSARLEHPHIVPIHGFGIDDDVPWMAMRLIAGGNAAHALRQGALSPVRAIRILRDAAEALDYAHGKGIIHRDVKPHNILLDEDDRAYLADFGIARILEGATHLTRTGMLVGTPQYMAPEQARAGELDHRVDVYALGIVAYEFLTGRVPFQADTAVAVMMSHVMDPVPVPDAAAVPGPLTATLLKCLAKDRDERWPSATAFVEALDSAQATVSTPAVRPGALASGAGASSPTAAGGGGRRLLVAAGLLVVVSGLAVFGRDLWRDVRWPSSAPETSPAAARPAPTLSAESPPPASEPEAATAPSPSPALPSPIAGASTPPGPTPPPADPPPPGAKPGQSWTSRRDGLDYAWLPSASSFKIGCVGSDKECYDDEKPRKAVAFAKGFWLTKTEVTVAAYKRFAEATGRSLPSVKPPFNPGWKRDELPMSYVTWEEAAAFCSWTGGRLPTEAEWEYGARAGREGNKYPWGQEPPSCRKGAPNGARFNDGAACKEGAPDPVGTYGANRLGLFDVAGNVWEWCDDWYDAKAYAAEGKGPAEGKERVIRGGAMNSKASGLRLSLRNRLSPTSRSVYVGLRCAID